MDPNDYNKDNKDNKENNSNRKPTDNNNLLLPVHLRNHLVRVYSTLTGTTATTVLGVFSPLSIPPLLSLLVGVGIIFFLNSTRPDYLTSASTRSRTPLNQNYRLLLLLLYGFLQGTLLTPLLITTTTSTTLLNPQLLTTTLFYTLIVFGSFTMAALSTERQSLLFLRGPLMAGLLILLMTSLFLPLSSVEVYLGLLVFIGFILYDTQLIVERADYEMSYLQNGGEGELRRGDYVSHAMELFMDLYNLFIRILELFQRQEENRRSSRRSK